MSRKGIILAIIIFIGLGLYVFLIEKKKPFPESKEVILKFDKDKARRLTINHNGKEIVLNKDKDGKWQITAPLFTKADDEVVKELIDDLSNFNASQTLEVDPSEWEDFGLKKPGSEVTVLIDSHEERLSFGDKNPAGTSIYARMRGRDKIFLVSTYSANSFKKELFDLRNKTIFSLEKNKLEKIELIYPDRNLVLEKEKMEKEGEEYKWFLAGKEKIELDSDKMNDLLWNLTDIQAKGIIAEEIKDPSLYGLDNPKVKVVITMEGKEKIILLGKKAGEKEDTVYAQVIGDPRLFLVSSDLSSSLTKDLSDLKKEKEEKDAEE